MVIATDGAAFRSALQTSSAPGVSGFGEHVNKITFSLSTVRFADACDVPSVAVIFAVAAPAVSAAVAVNGTEVAPAATVTVAGTVTNAVSLVNVTTDPP